MNLPFLNHIIRKSYFTVKCGQNPTFYLEKLHNNIYKNHSPSLFVEVN